ncbi:hypothetical protein H7J86_24575 [Mycobacterium hackensackense]|uniref:hypothetical protein n=1 Tax=Mycobacterium hackensackense TaxID=228909 RepID=UPI002265D35C|nr:hypothetical protein [Mycobacterium hackensackense]MCV7255343.1 hypothetical protein [Mycobacterium hackensackense]
MSAADEAPDDVEEALTAYLQALRTTAITRRPGEPMGPNPSSGDPLPMVLVRNITGSEVAEYGFSDQLVDVRTMCLKSEGEDQAIDDCADTHAWMLNLAINQEDIVLQSGRIVNFDYVSVFESPHWIKFDNDLIIGKLAKYSVGLSYVKR